MKFINIFQYVNVEKTKRDVLTALQHYRGLGPKLDKFGKCIITLYLIFIFKSVQTNMIEVIVILKNTYQM